MNDFEQHIREGYVCQGPSVVLGSGIWNGSVYPTARVHIPLRTMNRHGLVAGATGTGKTKTLQVLAEQLSQNGVSVLMMDIKGDISGLAAPGTSNPKIEERHKLLDLPYRPWNAPVELLSISGEKGVRLRATVSEFGPVLLAKILQLNDTQAGILGLLFKYADDKQLPLLDLRDLRKLIQYSLEEGKNEIKEHYGLITTQSASAVLRAITSLEQQGGDAFFGEPSFEVEDLVRIDDQGQGIISILRLSDMQDRPALFSTFMLCLLAELYQKFPEEGDAEQPKLCIFIDEAHLIFQEASKALLQQLETVVKLIRSKGIGIFFCTQNPQDIPDSVLSQLGLKIQHALRAFTEKDRKAIKKASENYPISAFYKTDELITALGIGEAFCTALNEKGIPTPLVHVMLRAPQTRMDVLAPVEIDTLLAQSKLAARYNTPVDRESAYEILSAKLQEAAQEAAEPKAEKTKDTASKNEKEEPGMLEKMSKNTMVRQVGNTVMREVTRGILGVLGLKGSRSKRKSGWF